MRFQNRLQALKIYTFPAIRVTSIISFIHFLFSLSAWKFHFVLLDTSRKLSLKGVILFVPFKVRNNIYSHNMVVLRKQDFSWQIHPATAILQFFISSSPSVLLGLFSYLCQHLTKWYFPLQIISVQDNAILPVYSRLIGWISHFDTFSQISLYLNEKFSSFSLFSNFTVLNLPFTKLQTLFTNFPSQYFFISPTSRIPL